MKYTFQSCLLFLVFLIYVQCALGQNHFYSDKYDLNFDFRNKQNLTWSTDPLFPVLMQPDSTQTVNGKNPLRFVQSKKGPLFVPINASIHQTVLLPETNADSASILFTCKSKDLMQMQLIISVRSNRETILHTDTLSALGSEDWTTFYQTIPIRGAAMLHLNIVAQGKKYPYTEQKLYLDKIEIKIGGKDINEGPLPSIPVMANLKKSDIISLSLSDTNSFKRIPEIGNHKIVALGETIHGSESINEAAVELIKYQVLHNQCKFILLELPTEQSLYWNRYIQGDSLFKIEHFAHHFSLDLLSPKVMIDFFNWLRKHNETIKDKVLLMGMDISRNSWQCSEYLFDFLSTLNKNKHNPLLDSMCSNLSRYNIYSAVDILKKQKELEEVMNRNEYMIIRYCMNTTISNMPADQRDDLMFIRASFLMKQICPGEEKTMVYAHFGHINPIKNGLNLSFTTPFGYFMKKKFGNDYYSIALLSGEGSFRTTYHDTLLVQKAMQTPILNSLDELLMRTDEALCFVPASAIPKQLMYMRDVGNTFMENQFEIMAPASRMDAVMFIRNNKAFDILPETLKDSKEYLIHLKQLKERLQQSPFSHHDK